MSKLIINNRSDLSDTQAMKWCADVVDGGRISDNGKSYCGLTCITTQRGTYQIAADVNKASDKLTVAGPFQIRGMSPNACSTTTCRHSNADE